MDEVATHNKPGDLWVVIKGMVYDLSTFYLQHPGGKNIVLQSAGKDVSQIFDPFHPGDIIQRTLDPALCLGPVDQTTVKPKHVAGHNDEEEEEDDDDDDVLTTKKKKKWMKPQLGQMLNVYDFEEVAKHTMTKQGWSYYSSGADDEITLRENHIAFQRIWLRPRVLVNVRTVNMTTSLLGYFSSLPLYITATALGKLAHDDGELAIVRAAATKNIIYMLPTLSSYTLSEMLHVRQPNQIQFGQLYVNSDRAKTKAYIEELEQGRYTFFIFYFLFFVDRHSRCRL